MKRAIFAIGLLFLIYAVVWAIYSHTRNKNDKGYLVLYGNVDVRQVDIGFRVSGQVSRLCYEEGDWVGTGSLLAVLDSTPYDSQLAQAIANRDALQATLDNAEILLERRQLLIDSGGVSQEDLDNAQAKRDELAAQLVAAEATIDVARDQLKYTEVYAPTDGTILTRIREPGTVVNPADPVFTLSVASPVWIRAFVDEPHLGDVCYGMEAEISTDTVALPTYKGYVGFVSPVAEFTPKTVQTTQLRTDLVYRLRIYANNPDRYLKQGMPVTVKLKLQDQKQ
jgi:HlyD family secretion protein